MLTWPRDPRTGWRRNGRRRRESMAPPPARDSSWARRPSMQRRTTALGGCPESAEAGDFGGTGRHGASFGDRASQVREEPRGALDLSGTGSPGGCFSNGHRLVSVTRNLGGQGGELTAPSHTQVRRSRRCVTDASRDEARPAPGARRIPLFTPNPQRGHPETDTHDLPRTRRGLRRPALVGIGQVRVAALPSNQRHRQSSDSSPGSRFAALRVPVGRNGGRRAATPPHAASSSPGPHT